MQNFIIKAYSKKELSLLYFPHTDSPRVAVNHFMEWVRHCKPLMAELAATGYEKTAKYFTPRQVKAIFCHLGEPYEET